MKRIIYTDSDGKKKIENVPETEEDKKIIGVIEWAKRRKGGKEEARKKRIEDGNKRKEEKDRIIKRKLHLKRIVERWKKEQKEKKKKRLEKERKNYMKKRERELRNGKVEKEFVTQKTVWFILMNVK